MSAQFCLTVRFLQPYFHGRGESSEPEWPPSPLRVYQALVAAASARFRTEKSAEINAALAWLSQIEQWLVIAPIATTASTRYRLYVPDNVADLVAKSWVAGRENSIADYRTEKDVQPTVLADEAIHLVVPAAPDNSSFQLLKTAARSITHLGWGCDMVVGDANLLYAKEIAALPGERWKPQPGPGTVALRVPCAGTLDDLRHKHEAFLRRLGPDGFRPVPPLTVYRVVGYSRDHERQPPAIAAFQLLKLDGDAMRAFDTARRTTYVSAMLKHAAKTTAQSAKKSSEWISRVVCGHAAQPAAQSQPSFPHSPVPQRADDVVGHNRLAYLPLPSLEGRGADLPRVVGPIRRVLITSFGTACQSDVAWARRALAGAELLDEHAQQATAYLASLPNNERMVQNYVGSAAMWSTVTPVILPGFDRRKTDRDHFSAGKTTQYQLERLALRTEQLLRKAILQAGFSEELAHYTALEWRDVPFWPGAEPASHFFVPQHLRQYPRVHVRLVWHTSSGPCNVQGPVCLGGGRYFGLGLFAKET